MYRIDNWWARKCNIVFKQHLILMTEDRIRYLNSSVIWELDFLLFQNNKIILMIENRTDYLQIRKCSVVLKQYSFLMIRSRTDYLWAEMYETDYLWVEKYRICHLWVKNRIIYLWTERCKISYLQTENKINYL